MADSLQVVIHNLPGIQTAGPIGFQICHDRRAIPSSILQQPFITNSDVLEKWIKQYGQRVCYWIRFSLENTDPQPVRAYLHVDYFGKMVLYALLPDDTPQLTGGPAAEKSASTPPSLLQTVEFEIPPQRQTTYLLQLSSTSDDEVGMSNLEIYSRPSLLQSFLQQYYGDRRARFLQLLFLGFMCSQMLYVLFQWIIVKRKEYPCYFLYLVLVTMYYLHKYYQETGIYWPFAYYPELRFYLKAILLMLPYLFYLMFIRYFLELKHLDASVEKSVRYLEHTIWIYVIIDLVLRILFPGEVWINDLLMVSIIFVFACCLYLIFKLIKHHDILVTLILTGSMIAGLGGVIGILITLLQIDWGLLSSNLNSLVTGQIGVVIETIIFTTSLGLKNRRVEKEKIKHQQRLIAQLQENEQLRKNMDNIRNNIAKDLHDDIGATLTSILLYSNAAVNRKKMTLKEAKNIFRKISQISADMMENMSDIVWAIHPVHDSMKKLIQRMIYYALPLTRAKNIQFHFEEEEHIREVILNMNKRKNIFLIFKEGVCNVLKYAEASTVVVRLYQLQGNLHLTIEDDGKGFIETQTEGNGLKNMKFRAEECGGSLTIESAPGKGTHIHLQVPI